MTEQTPPEPEAVVMMVEQYVRNELAAEQAASNRKPLDESGIYSLHMVAARIYAAGFADGERAAERRADGERSRLRDR